MRIYSAASQEDVRARSFLKEWAAEGLLTQDQHELLKQDLVSDLSTTNLFLRIVLFFFTLVCVGAIAGLFLEAFLRQVSELGQGLFCLLFAAACYAAAEVAVTQAHFYRHGIEEALAVSSIGLLYPALGLILNHHTGTLPSTDSLIPAICAVLALWIWYRFDLWYTFPAAMILAATMPPYWTVSHPAQLILLTGFYSLGLVAIVMTRARHRFDYLNPTYSLAEAFLWFALYITLNLKLSTTDLLIPWIGMPTRFIPGPAGPFYWITWVLIWCLPPAILTRGIHQKDRFVIQAGAFTLLLTFITNKPYLGWTRHTWDPILLGIILTATAYLLRRWLAQGPDGVRHNFTAANLSVRDKRRINTASALLGFASAPSSHPNPQADTQHLQPGDGASGGAGASRDF